MKQRLEAFFQRSDGLTTISGLAMVYILKIRLKKCSDKPSVAVQRDETMFMDNCFDTIPGKILIGIVDELVQDVTTLEDCIKACQKRQGSGVICKSAAYSYKEKVRSSLYFKSFFQECIIASQSRSDIPDLFIDDEKFVYIENGCLSGHKETSLKKISVIFVNPISIHILSQLKQSPPRPRAKIDQKLEVD